MPEERLYSTEQAGELLSMTADEVLRHIHAGHINAKRRPTPRRAMRKDGSLRKERPRYFITSAEISRYIGSLPDANPVALEPLPKRRRRGLTKAEQAEIDSCVRYV